ncbi:MAG: hypothetical protein FIA92_02760, partial [Chloroflexi bacterium]|nr:hypothetical protein [Chloroflexota bacterium]
MTLDQADFLDQLATQVASVVDRLDAMQMAQLEAALLPQSTVPRSGSIGTPTTALGQGDVQPSSVLANGAVTSAAIADGAVTSTKIVAGAVAMTKFAQSIIPPRVVTALPTLPADDWPTGCYVFLTTDETLYKNVAGTWTAASETELVANTIYAGSIAAGAIGARELAATIVLASLIKTANTGARVEIDQNG